MAANNSKGIATFKRRLAIRALVALAGVMLSILILPHLISAYYLQAGGKALDDKNRLTYNPSLALEHLQTALEWDVHNAYAYRLMGKAYQAQGNWLGAIQALKRYTELQPDSLSGHIELAQVYEAVDADIHAMNAADLVLALSEATVTALDGSVSTYHVRSNDPTEHGYVTATTLSLPPDFDNQPALLMHMPSWVSYTISLPPEPTILRFGMSIDPQLHNLPGDNVVFEVQVNGESIFLERMDQAMASEGWHKRTVDLTPWSGKEIALTLVATPGSMSDISGDLVGWGKPQVVDSRIASLEKLQPELYAIEEWRRAGVTAQDLIREGNRAFAQQQYDRAMRLYKRGETMEGAFQSSELFRWAIAAIMTDHTLPQSLMNSTAVPVYDLIESAQIEAEKLKWMLADSYWDINYGDRLIDHPSRNPSVGVLWWGGPAVAFVHVQHEATYQITVRAKHSISGPGQLHIEKNFSPIALFSLTPNWQDFTATVHLSAGFHIIDLQYTQLAKGVDGDAIIDWIRFQRNANSGK